MSTKQAIANRIIQLCADRKIAINELASTSGVSPSTVYSILDERSQNPGAVTIKNYVTVWKLPLVNSSAPRNSTHWSRKSNKITLPMDEPPGGFLLYYDRQIPIYRADAYNAIVGADAHIGPAV